jgi:hypothetical protein
MRKVVFYHEGKIPSFMEIFTRSVRKHIPLPLVFMTCGKTLVDGVDCDEVVRLPSKGIGHGKYNHLAHCEGDVLLLDTDILVQRDVQDVFDEDFDVAMCPRKHTNPEGVYNGGVMFSRCPAFFAECVRKMDEDATGYGYTLGGEQIVMNRVAATGKWKIKDLPLDVYNWSPKLHHMENPQAAIVHYKGERKRWMR